MGCMGKVVVPGIASQGHKCLCFLEMKVEVVMVLGCSFIPINQTCSGHAAEVNILHTWHQGTGLTWLFNLGPIQTLFLYQSYKQWVYLGIELLDNE